MFTPRSVHPTIPVRDLDAAKAWYAEKLGIEPAREAFAGTNQATTAEFIVDDVPAAVEELRRRGVVFEDYDFPELRTVEGIATFGDQQSAWFRDLDGNILALTSIP